MSPSHRRPWGHHRRCILVALAAAAKEEEEASILATNKTSRTVKHTCTLSPGACNRSRCSLPRSPSDRRVEWGETVGEIGGRVTENHRYR